MVQGSTFNSKVYNKLKLIHTPHLKLYEGFGNATHCTIMGHSLLVSPHLRKKYKRGVWHNTISLLRLFMIKPYSKAKISVTWQNEVYTTTSEKDGFFIFNIPNTTILQSGAYTVNVQLMDTAGSSPVFETTAHITIPERNQFSFISDIDDTFLISHSSTIFKRMRVLLTRNAHSRKAFEGVINHYNALQLAHTIADNPNPFFYVSSSEWNLYDFLIEFMKTNHLPDGICLLNQLKTFSQLLKTGKNNHGSKFTRIVRLLEAYPTQRFILLGDDSQHDPFIYQSLCEHFPHLIYCVYIRCVGRHQKRKVAAVLREIADSNIAICYFEHSSEAFEHSRQIGLISENA